MRLTQYPKELKKSCLKYFRSLLLTAESAEEAYLIIDGLFTPKEKYSIGRRVEIAHMLAEGYKYEEIQKALKTTSITVSRVSKMIDDNPNIFNRVLHRYQNDEGKIKPVRYIYSKGSLQAFGKVTKSGTKERDLKR